MVARRLAIRQGCRVVVTASELGLWWSDIRLGQAWQTAQTNLPGRTRQIGSVPFYRTGNLYLALSYGSYPAPRDFDRLIPFCCHPLGRDWSRWTN
jgi:hypothetical protein